MTEQEIRDYVARGCAWVTMDDVQKAHASALRLAYDTYTKAILEHAPASRRRSLALTAAEEASSWAIKSVALGE